MLGERLCQLVSFEAAKLAAGAVMLSPFVPMLFMGEEYADPSPFLYFVSHSDEHLINSVRKGRRKEFKKFKWKKDPPDPQSLDTFNVSKLQWEKRSEGKHAVMLDFYRELIALRNTIPALGNLDKNSLDVREGEEERTLLLRRWLAGNEVICLMNFNDRPVQWTSPLPEGTWDKRFDSSDTRWMGPGAQAPETVTESADAQGSGDGSKCTAGGSITLNPHSFVVYS